MKLEREKREAQDMALIHLLSLILFPLFTTTHIAQATSSSWAQTTPHTKISNPNSQNLTKLHFYFHDITSGNEKSVAIIATANNSTPFGFGTLVMIDDPLTVGPDRKSKLIGRAQGMYGLASQTEPILLLTVTFSFLEGSYNGSSISVLGRYNVADQERELPIIGGSGVFKFASGYAISKRYRSSMVNDEDTAEYHVVVLHSDVSSMF